MTADRPKLDAEVTVFGDARAADQLSGDQSKAAALAIEVQTQVAGFRAQIADLQAQIADLTATPAFVMGGAVGGNTDPASIEARVGKPFGTSRTYWGPTDAAKAVTRITADAKAGRAVSHVSFKLPFSWKDMAAGVGDAWALDLSTKLQAAVTEGHLIRLALHHEPENDTGTNAGNTAVGRDQWKAMQLRLAPMFDKPGIMFVVVLMGYHSYSSNSPLISLWRPELGVPLSPAIKGVGYDPYEAYGAKVGAKWTNWDTYFAAIGAFHALHPGLAWGISETGVVLSAFTAHPTWFDDFTTKMIANQGSWFDYFNSGLNSIAKWNMDPGEAREKAFFKTMLA